MAESGEANVEKTAEPMYLSVRIPECGSMEVATMDMLDDVMAHFQANSGEDDPEVEIQTKKRIATWFKQKYGEPEEWDTGD